MGEPKKINIYTSGSEYIILSLNCNQILAKIKIKINKNVDFFYNFIYNMRKKNIGGKTTMYERSAIVLERYIDQLFGFNKEHNLRNNFLNFGNLIEELKEYQAMLHEEENVIGKFDEIAQEIQTIQKLQEKLCLSNQKLENERNKLFNEIEGNPNTVQNRLEKLENIVDENNEELKKLREQYIKAFVIFIERQKERNKFARKKRTVEANHLAKMKEINKRFQGLDTKYVQVMKRFLDNDKGKIKDEITDIMIKNGKNEKIGFNRQVIDNAVDIRTYISEREAECYIKVYEKIKKLLSEVDNDNLKLDNYERLFRDTSVKLAFLNAEKEYIVEFLDNERMTVIGGIQVHEKMMDEACRNFETDIRQIDNLYELILREITGKSEKSAYEELYNKTYLRDIQEEEKSFEAEVTNIKINMGTVINSNYWRIEGIKHVYDVFQKEVTEKFGKDLSEYQVEEIEEIVDLQEKMNEKMNVLKTIQDTIQEQVRSTINANNNIKPKLHSQYIYEEGNQYDDDYEEDEYEDKEDEYSNDETNNNNYQDNIFNNNQEYENITLFNDDKYVNTQYEEDESKDDEYISNQYYNSNEQENVQYNNDNVDEYENITLFDEEEQYYNDKNEEYEDNQYYNNDEDDDYEEEYEENQYYDNNEDDEYEEDNQYYDNNENDEYEEDNQYYDNDEEDDYEDDQYYDDEEDYYDENEYYDEEDEYDQYDDEDMDDDNRYEKYKSKYLNDEVTYANSYNSQNNRVLSRMKEDEDDDEADIYSVMFSKINNTNIKKRKTPSERIKRNIATKNKKSKRKQKDVYSFQGTNNVFNKIFKKR